MGCATRRPTAGGRLLVDQRETMVPGGTQADGRECRVRSTQVCWFSKAGFGARLGNKSFPIKSISLKLGSGRSIATLQSLNQEGRDCPSVLVAL